MTESDSGRSATGAAPLSAVHAPKSEPREGQEAESDRNADLVHEENLDMSRLRLDGLRAYRWMAGLIGSPIWD